jgi:hypothetical protein
VRRLGGPAAQAIARERVAAVAVHRRALAEQRRRLQRELIVGQVHRIAQHRDRERVDGRVGRGVDRHVGGIDVRR